MKDAYSFDLSDDDAKFSYNKFFLSYLRTFKRLELSAIPMAADTGPIGGNLSHEFIILAETGESKIYTDKRIFEVDSLTSSVDRNSLTKLRNDLVRCCADKSEPSGDINASGADGIAFVLVACTLVTLPSSSSAVENKL